MTEDLRELYRSHEHLMDGANDRLLPTVRARRRRTKIKERIGYASTALLVVAVIGGMVAFGPFRSAGPVHVAKPQPVQTAPAGYRLEGSLGLQIAVPAGWKTNDFGCGQDDQPSVVRALGFQLACLTPTPVTKEFALIGLSQGGFGYKIPAVIDADVSQVAVRNVTIDGVAATRAAGPLGDGRFAGWIIVASRNVALVVRTNSEAELTTILNSARVVTIDRFGCATAAPPPLRPKLTAGSTFVDSAPSAVSVCYYGGEDVLQISTRRTGPSAVAVAAALNATPHGANPDRPDTCVHSAGPQKLDAVLLIYPKHGPVQTVNLSFQSCVDIHLDNGREYRGVSFSLLKVIMDGTDTGYGSGGDIPQ